MKCDGSFLEISERKQRLLIDAAIDTRPVSGLTHNFYKYPARFSPLFVRAAIEAFSRRGDLVMDPHVGGGTTLVEALCAGRDAIGVDISPLAEFVTRVKTTIFSEAELERLDTWAKRLPAVINLRKYSFQFGEYARLGYYKHIDCNHRWRLRKAIEQAIYSAMRLDTPRLESFGRCAVLRTSQWALDGRAEQPTIAEFREFLSATAAEMVAGARALRATVQANGYRPTIEILSRSAAGLEHDMRTDGWRPPRLIVTSPPYPGVHVLYHRWQVDGGKEAPLPFMIAGKLDGAGSSYYTMGDRKYPALKTYFNNIRATMSSVAALSDEQTAFVQIVAFSDPSWQLPRYLETMEEAGLQEIFIPSLRGRSDGRLWRSVPGRRWYSDQRGETPGSNEVVMIHRKAAAAPRRCGAKAVAAQSLPSA